jgi:LysM repeat protein
MKQVKRLFYMVVLNVIISAITVGVVLQLWERDHPLLPSDSTPMVIVVTPTQSISLPMIVNNVTQAFNTPAGEVISGTVQTAPTPEMLVYRIKQGDTLGALSVQFNISLNDIMTVNGMTDPDSVYVGQLINIPTAPLPYDTPTAVPVSGIISPTPRPSLTPTTRPTSTPSPTTSSAEAKVIIDTVVGVGVLANEHVVFRRTGEGELSLVGWRLSDGGNNTYIFPQLTLYKDSTINLNTRTGLNTVTDLFWNFLSPIWSSGKTMSLFDAQNNLRATYTVP